ncbi:hypothetical protein CDES_10280 [Corynebacterium deserti GIMN1.010]|uniref:Uncharacterized protein n=1 Tax=Corynebacterium deserti GIMN1.010 TaxID=931089 RepID=A0A0M4CJC9_9CORY|nr:hypothetical protein CDES_10280 [Corynebacterium deserti GIMN1.010]
MVTYLLPIPIAYSSGCLIYDVRSGSPMFLGAMICGPLFTWLMKKIDSLWAGQAKPGFEMLVDNFSAGIFAAIGTVESMFLLAPVNCGAWPHPKQPGVRCGSSACFRCGC